jgi:hypothetical protein
LNKSLNGAISIEVRDEKEEREQTRQFLREILYTLSSNSLFPAIFLIGIGVIYTLISESGLWILGAGFGFFVLWLTFHGKRPTTGLLYPSLFAGATELFIVALAFYAANFASFLKSGELPITLYYSLLALSVAFFLAGVTDYGVRSSRIATEQKIQRLEQRLFGDGEQQRSDGYNNQTEMKDSIKQMPHADAKTQPLRNRRMSRENWEILLRSLPWIVLMILGSWLVEEGLNVASLSSGLTDELKLSGLDIAWGIASTGVAVFAVGTTELLRTWENLTIREKLDRILNKLDHTN